MEFSPETLKLAEEVLKRPPIEGDLAAAFRDFVMNCPLGEDHA
jgi:hypothetical protein